MSFIRSVFIEKSVPINKCIYGDRCPLLKGFIVFIAVLRLFIEIVKVIGGKIVKSHNNSLSDIPDEQPSPKTHHLGKAMYMYM